MALIKSKDIAKMNDKEINEKLEELKVELLKSRINHQKGGKSNMKEIKKTVARLLTLKRTKQIAGDKK